MERLYRELLVPIVHSRADNQVDLAVLRARKRLVRCQTALVNHVRGSVKAVEGRLPSGSTASLPGKIAEHLPCELEDVLHPTLDTIAELTRKIRPVDRRIEGLCRERYPETELLGQVGGVGALTALCYVLVIDDPVRFEKCRDVSSNLGLLPGQDQSGALDPDRGITKAGDPMLRRLLVGAATTSSTPSGGTVIFGAGGRSSWSGGEGARKRATVAVARRLAVLRYRLRVTGEVYEPSRNAKPEEAETEAA